MKKIIKFEDAQALHQLHPDTFEAPTPEDLQDLKPGDFVKVCALRERFWAEVIAVETGVITARVDNNLIMNELSYNDTIRIKPENIYDILKPSALSHFRKLSAPPKTNKQRKRGRKP